MFYETLTLNSPCPFYCSKISFRCGALPWVFTLDLKFFLRCVWHVILLLNVYFAVEWRLR